MRLPLRVAAAVGWVTVAACFSPPAAPDASTEDELRFRSDVVDTSLPDVDALGYEAALDVDDTHGREAYTADVKGTYVATRSLTELSLDFVGNEIDEITVSGRPATHRRQGDELIIRLPEPIAKGKTFSTRVRYHAAVTQADGANPNDFSAFGGLSVRQRNAEGKRIYSSLNWPSKARRWLPLRDHPRDGAMLAMTATFPRGFTVVANGKQIAREDVAADRTTWRFEALTPMPTYDFHLAAYEGWKVDEARSASGIRVASYTYAGAQAGASRIYRDLPRAMDFYEASFGKYRWGTASFLEEPIFGGGMEHASVVSMDETLFARPEEARATAVHELAHHWSGNLARIRTWNDFWLSEGFTEYLTARFLAAQDGPEAKKTVYRGYLGQALAADRSSPHALRPADPEIDVLTIFDAISYQKGALVMRALERLVGEPALTTFLQSWFDRHAFGAVTTRDLERELAAHTGRDLSKFFESFVYAPGHPEVRVSASADGDGTVLKVEQLQGSGPAGGYVFPLDVDLVGDGGQIERVVVELTGKVTTQRFRTARAPRSLVVDPEEYLLGTVACGQSSPEAECKEGFRCQGGQPSVCVPVAR